MHPCVHIAVIKIKRSFLGGFAATKPTVMLRSVQFFVVLFGALFLLNACNTAQRFVESGDYDGAIDLCIRKIRGKKNKNPDYVKGLELAFEKATQRDMRLVDNLIASGREENWTKINSLHRRIANRQNKIQPLLPLYAKGGYQAKFKFVRIENLEQQSREKAAGYLYDCAEDLLSQAQTGDREAAREAYSKLREIENNYFQNFRNIRSLKREAEIMGTTHVLFQIGNQSNQVLPRDFNERVLAFSTNDLNSRWRVYHLERQSGVNYDYLVRFNVRSVDVSPERVSERVYTDEREIEDGFKYVLDENGNVKKDSLGNDIKAKKYRVVRANIIEVFQTKAVRLAGNLEVMNASGTNRLDSQQLNTEVLFENYASTFQGDRRALSKQSRQRIGNQPMPFPPTEQMLAQAADNLKPIIRDELRRSNQIF